MLKFIKTKKGFALLATLAVVAVAAVGAYAYFTSTGTGSGSATVGTSADNLAVTWTITNVGDKLYPGGPLIPVTVNVANPSNFAQAVTSVIPNGSTAAAVAAGADATTGAVTDAVGCSGADFHFYGDGVTANSALDTNGGTPYDLGASSNHDFSGAVIGMDNNGIQDACKNATVTFYFSSN